WITYPDAVVDIFLPPDESTDRAGQHLHRAAAVVQSEERQKRAVHQRRTADVSISVEEGNRESSHRSWRTGAQRPGIDRFSREAHRTERCLHAGGPPFSGFPYCRSAP